MPALALALENGFGIETDIRDHHGKLVISHDMPRGDEPTLRDLLKLHARSPKRPRLALNIKADGLQQALKNDLQDFATENYFVFDMSIPDMLSYADASMLLYCRLSEYETELPLLDSAVGVWLDAFHKEWMTPADINGLLARGKRVCLVSSELHGRDFRACWSLAKALDRKGLEICTDHPFEAKEYFNGPG